MKVGVERLPKQEARLTIELSAEELTPYAEKVAERLSRDFKVQGFRPGKAPVQMVISTVGQDKFESELLEVALPESYTRAITEQNLVPIIRPEIDLKSLDLKQGLNYEATVALIPEVKLADPSKLKLGKAAPATVSDEEIEETLQELRRSRASSVTVDRPAEQGDRVEIDFEGFRAGVPFEGGRSQHHPVILGEGLMTPGFEEALLGVKTGEEREFEVTFPADYHAGELAGQTVRFKTKTHFVQEITLPELSDEFAQGFGVETPEKLRDQVRSSLEGRARESEQERLRSEVLAALAEGSEVEISDRVILQEAEDMLHDLSHRLEHQGGSLTQYLHSVGKSEEELKRELRPEAERRIRNGLVLGEYARGLKIEISDAEVEATYTEAHRGHAHTDEEEEHGRGEVRSQLQTRKALDHLVDQVPRG